MALTDDTPRDGENFRRITAGLNEVAEMVGAKDNGIPAEEVLAAFHINRPVFCGLILDAKKVADIQPDRDVDK